MTNCCTLDNVADWVELAQKERVGRTKKPLIILVGNKVDQKSKRQVGDLCAEFNNRLFQNVLALFWYNVTTRALFDCFYIARKIQIFAKSINYFIICVTMKYLIKLRLLVSFSFLPALL